MTERDEVGEDEAIIASALIPLEPLREGNYYITAPGADFYNRARTRYPALVAEVRELREAIASYLHWLHAPCRGETGPHVTENCHAALSALEKLAARHEEGA